MNNKRWSNIAYSYLLRWILNGTALLLGGKLHAILEQPIKQFKRIIEVGTTRVRFTSCCLNSSACNYLGVLTKDSDPGNKTNPCILAGDRFFSLKRNNADILILSEPQQLRRIWFFNEYKHTQYVFYAPANLLASLSGLLGLVKNTLLRRIKVVGVINLVNDLGIKQPVLVVKTLKRIIPNARRYISPVLGVTNFFETLNKEQVRYAILRWFEDLPVMMPGEDIDMLVADENIDTVESAICQHPGIIPCDIYTVSGLPGTAYKNMAYYPPFLAEQILAETITIKETFLVPNRKVHFYSLAYHAIYHKGQKSGIPWSENNAIAPEQEPEHEYSQILRDLAQSIKIEVDITLKDLDRFLNNISWRPSEDTLARLDSSHIWLNSVSNDKLESSISSDVKGLAVFFVRQRALELNLESEIIELLTKAGFNLIESQLLTPEAAKRVKYQVRGGNWGKGPWSRSGGDPTMIIVAVDLMPKEPTKEELVKQPHLSNSRITVKNQIRDAVNMTLPVDQQCNTVHSSDNEREAWNYLEIALPEKCDRIFQEIERLRHDFQTNYQVKEVLTRFGRRAKVEAIEYKNQLAVKKTFKPGYEQFFEREVFVSRVYGQKLATIPEAIASGSNSLIYPYYNDVLKFKNRQSKLLPLSVVKEALATLKFFYEQGYALIDFQPANLIVDRHIGLKVIDFEFLYQYQDKPQLFEECYELAGIPDRFAGDKPDFQMEMSYDARWKPYTGLSLTSLLYDPTWLQHLKRFGFAVTHLPIRFIRNRFNKYLAKKKKKGLIEYWSKRRRSV